MSLEINSAKVALKAMAVTKQVNAMVILAKTPALGPKIILAKALKRVSSETPSKRAP